MARILEVASAGAALSGPDLRPSDAEMAVWALFAPYRLTNNALLIDIDRMPPEAENDPKPLRYTSKAALTPAYTAVNSSERQLQGSPTNRESGFYLLERVSNRILGPGNGIFHPVIILDTETGRPCMCFGAGGSGDNLLQENPNGALRPVSRINAAGAETNDVALFAPDQACSLFWKFRVPVASTTVNSVIFTTITGGCGLAGAGGANSPTFSINQTTGKVDLRNREVSAGLLGAANLKDSALHTIVAGYDPVANLYSCSVDGAAFTTQSNSTGIISGEADALRFTIGAFGDASLGKRYSGFMHAIGWLPSTILVTDAVAHAAVLAYLAEK